MESSAGRRAGLAAVLLAAAVLLVFGFGQLDAVVGGSRRDPVDTWLRWAKGTALCVAIGVGGAWIWRWLRPGPGFGEWWGTIPVVERHPRLWTTAVALLALAVYLGAAWYCFDLLPLLSDESSQVLHANILARGRLWDPVLVQPEFTATMQSTDFLGRSASQFPIGGPAMIALGSVLGAPWLAMPLFGALAVVAFAMLVRRVEPDRGTAALAVALFAFSPFVVFMSGSHMNHVAVVLWLLVSAAALARVVDAPAPRPLAAFVTGVGFGVAATIRPTDAFAFAFPAGLWLLWRTAHERRRWPDLVWSGLGVAIPGAILLWSNARLTGGPLLFAYEVLWGPPHHPGFHVDPTGADHTPLRGLEFTARYFVRLQSRLFETPFPSLLPATLALLLARRARPIDRWLLVSSGLVVASYLAYWHEGDYLGPRFLYPVAPVLVLWTARLPRIARERFGDLALRSSLVALAAGLVLALPQMRGRAYSYRKNLPEQRWNVDEVVRRAGVHDAVVIVRDGWAMNKIAQLNALGLDMGQAWKLVNDTDMCRLEQAFDQVVREGLRDSAAFRRLEPLADKRGRLTLLTSSSFIRYDRSQHYDRRCMRIIAENGAGSLDMFQVRIGREPRGNIFVRDLHARDTLVLGRWRDRPVYLLHRSSPTPGDEVVLSPVSRDSLARAWAEIATPAPAALTAAQADGGHD